MLLEQGRAVLRISLFINESLSLQEKEEISPPFPVVIHANTGG
jgi:hypothetical protein